LPPAPTVLERKGVLVSGMLLAPLGYRDRSFLGLGHDIGIHDLESGSEAEANELQYWDLVLAVNGVDVTGMEQLHELLLAASRARGEVTVDFLRRQRASRDVVFEPLRRQLKISRPEWISVGGRP
jgi:S1-C subfamily serine protease